MNCPKCNYPDGPKPGDAYKGLYSPGSACSGCGFIETNAGILDAYKGLRAAIETRSDFEELLQDLTRRTHTK